MPRPKKGSIAIQPVQGKRKTFDDSDDSDRDDGSPIAGPSRQKLNGEQEEDEDEDEDDDDDDAPEAVTAGSARKGLRSEEDEAVLAEQSKRKAAAARSKAIAETKSARRAAQKAAQEAQKAANKPNPAGSKRQRKLAAEEAQSSEEDDEEDDDDDDDGEDAEGARLRKRMEDAMAAGDEESEGSDGGSDDEDEDDGENEEDEDEEMESYHTDSEDEGDEEEEEEEDVDSDDSETLRDGPLSAKDRQLRAEMQAMMEAAEARSGISLPSTSKTADSSSLEGKKPKSALKTGTGKKPSAKNVATKEPEEGEGEESFDLAPLNGFGRPLSVKVLKAAADEEEQRKLRIKEEKEIERIRARENKKENRKKRKFEKKETTKEIGNGKHLQLLEPDLPTLGHGGLPPVIDAQKRKPAGTQSRNKFFKFAMRNSGVMPGRGVIDGRKKARI